LSSIKSAAIAFDESLAQDSDGDSGLPGAGVSDKDDVFGPLNEVELCQGHDLCFIDSGLTVEGKRGKGPIPGYFGLSEAIVEASLLAVYILLRQKAEEDLGRWAALFFGPRQFGVDGGFNAVQAQGGEQVVEFTVFHRRSPRR
jgi:hypothetical protein